VSQNRESGSSTAPIGTLTQKIHFQEAASVMPPPITGPSAIATPASAPQPPMARPRRSGRTAADSRVRVSGTMIAPPRPCIARKAISAPMFGASAEPTEPSVNTAQADAEQPLAAVAVAEGGPGEQEDGEGERVGGDGPLQPGKARVQRLLDRGQRRGDDEVVELRHEHRGADDDERAQRVADGARLGRGLGGPRRRHGLRREGRFGHDGHAPSGKVVIDY
jgi:hypothetical protein